MSGALRIVDVGWGTTLQDAGRVGFAHLGVPGAGPVDRGAAAYVNRMVGNPPDATVVETLGGLVVEARSPVVVATSSDGTRLTLRTGGRVRVDAGERVWAYLGVRGGVLVDRVLGSASHDTLSGLGPAPIEAGHVLAVGGDPGGELVAEVAPRRPYDGVVDVWPGPHEHVVVGGVAALCTMRWRIGALASRVGVRLVPAGVDRLEVVETAWTVPSQGLVVGAIQLTPGGEAVVMLADHPTTGGYPVVGVVEPDHIGALAQRRAGHAVHLRPHAGARR